MAGVFPARSPSVSNGVVQSGNVSEKSVVEEFVQAMGEGRIKGEDVKVFTTWVRTETISILMNYVW